MSARGEPQPVSCFERLGLRTVAYVLAKHVRPEGFVAWSPRPVLCTRPSSPSVSSSPTRRCCASPSLIPPTPMSTRAPTAPFERLEFLGDAVLGMVVAERLYEHFPEVEEGTLTLWRAHIVQGPTLADAAQRLGLGRWLLLGRGEEATGGRDRHGNLADAYEALVGALKLDRGPDGGLEGARRFIERTLAPELEALQTDPAELNTKGALQQFCEGRFPRPQYVTVDERGPEHAREFSVEVRIDGEAMGRGERAHETAGGEGSGPRGLAATARPGAAAGRNARPRNRRASPDVSAACRGVRVQGLRGPPGLRVRPRPDRRGRTQRLRQVQRLRRDPLAPRRAIGALDPRPQDRRRDLLRLRWPARDGRRRGDALPRQLRAVDADRLRRGERQPARLPQRRERIPHQRAEGAAAGRAGPLPPRPGRPELLRDDVAGASSTRCSACGRWSAAT